MCILIDLRCCIKLFSIKKFIFLPTDLKKSHKVTGNDNIFLLGLKMRNLSTDISILIWIFYKQFPVACLGLSTKPMWFSLSLRPHKIDSRF